MYTTIKSPWLVQRGSFKDIDEKDIVGIDSLISYDYMGSSEFEFGTLGYSLKRMISSWDQYEWFPLEYIKDTNGNVLYILCRKGQKEEIIKVVDIFASEKNPYLKERIGLYNYLTAESKYALDINFWWDVTSDNDWMACLGNNIRRLVIAINKVCEKRDIDIAGPAIPPISNKVIRPDIKIDSNNTVIKVLFPDGKSTTIVKRNIISAKEDSESIKLVVKTKSGTDKDLIIKIPLSSTHTILWNLVKDWPEINKRS